MHLEALLRNLDPDVSQNRNFNASAYLHEEPNRFGFGPQRYTIEGGSRIEEVS
jgi:hypothetical protein